MIVNISKAYNPQGSITIKATTKGNKIVQQNDINWSYLIRGNDALAHIKVNIRRQDFKPKDKP